MPVSTGFQYLTETYIATQRIDKFLSMPEPPPPVHMRAKPAAAAATAANESPASLAPAGGNAAVGSSQQASEPEVIHQQAGQQHVNGARATPVLQASVGAAGAIGVVLCDHPDGYVELGGADYDWNTNVEEMAAQVGCVTHRLVAHVTGCHLTTYSCLVFLAALVRHSLPRPGPLLVYNCCCWVAVLLCITGGHEPLCLCIGCGYVWQFCQPSKYLDTVHCCEH